ncbi:MAG: hypothetical protein J6Q69_03255 [Clostridia bacterium]|nr:hypothetical protein [Clostridia bacterium]
MRYFDFTKEDEESFVALTERGLTAVFIYTNKVLHNGKRYVICEDDRNKKIIVASGEMCAPVCFFEKFFGARLNDDGSALSLGGVTLDITDMKREGCLPIERVCGAFGIASRIFSNGSFLVMGDAALLDELCGSETLIKAGPYALFGDYDTSSFTDADYEAAAKNFHDMLVGTEETNDLSDPFVRERINGRDKTCREALETRNEGDDPAILWGEKLLRDTEDGAAQYSKIRKIAMAYATYGCYCYKDEAVLKKIIFCLDWMYRHAYGEDMIEGHGWRDPKLPNWWYMYIGAPELLADILFMLYDEIGLEERAKYLKCFEWIASWMCLGPQWKTTRVKICTEYGVLLHKPEYLVRESEDYDGNLHVRRLDYIDFSHTYPHNMSYGGLFYSRFVLVASALAGTALEYNTPNAYTQFLRLKYMYEPAMYKGQAFFMLGGRHTHQMIEAAKATEFLVYLLSLIGVWGKDEDDYIKRFLKKHSVNAVFKNAMLKTASLVDIKKYEDILNDDTICAEYDNECAYSWFTGDRAVQHRNNYAFGIAMASNRHINYESILHQNPNGWYSGDGAFHTYTSYDSSQYDGVNFLRNMNIAYRFPGTTEDMQQRAVRGIFCDAWKTPAKFAGSLECRKKYITAGMDFISEFCEGAHEDVYDEVRGYGRAKHDNDLVAKKSWFLFDKEAVLLGAGITSTMNSPVNTTVEHRRIVKDEEYSQLVKANGEVKALPKDEFEMRFEGPDYLMWGGHAGYVFLDKTNLFVSRYNYTTNTEQAYLEIRAEHGANPVSEKYAYAVIPYADECALEAYSKSPEVEILSNTDKIQAVRKGAIGVTGIVFHEGAQIAGISADKGAIVTLIEEGNKLEVSVCEPTQEAEELLVKVSGNFRALSTEGNLTVTDCGDLAEIRINSKGAMGAPFRVTLEKI